jgi:hypothetical protein
MNRRLQSAIEEARLHLARIDTLYAGADFTDLETCLRLSKEATALDSRSTPLLRELVSLVEDLVDQEEMGRREREGL